MKNLILTLVFVMATLTAYAQNENTIKFLGIPVNGTKTEMIRRLQGKGFTYDTKQDRLAGKFNGKSVSIYVSENHGKVDRIMVADASTTTAAQVIVDYNTLLAQFKNSEKYLEFDKQPSISYDENLSYEYTVKGKIYEASFYPIPSWTNREKYEIFKKIEQLQTEEERNRYLIERAMEKISGMVWFRIAEYYGEFYICIYYDNLNNRPNGEDL